MTVTRGSCDFAAAKQAHDDAATQATDYLTDITGGGVMVHPDGDSTTGWKIASALEMLKSGVSYIKMWMNNNVPTIRIGKEDAGHLLIDNDSMSFRNDDEPSVEINANGMEFYALDENDDSVVYGTIGSEGNADGIRLSVDRETDQNSRLSLKDNSARLMTYDDSSTIHSMYGNGYHAGTDIYARQGVVEIDSIIEKDANNYINTNLLVGPHGLDGVLAVEIDRKASGAGGQKTLLELSRDGNLMASGMAGMIQMFAGATAPKGWLMCDGSAVSRTDYATLFAVIGTTYGTGDGSTTFNLPDLRGRAPIGAGTGTGLTARTLGDQTIGSESVKLTGAQSGQKAITISSSGAHVHSGKRRSVFGSGSTAGFVAGTATQSDATVNQVTVNSDASSGATGTHTHSISASNATDAHNNMQPSAVVNFIICTGKTS